MSYVDEVIELVVKKNPDEPEFHQAGSGISSCSCRSS